MISNTPEEFLSIFKKWVDGKISIDVYNMYIKKWECLGKYSQEQEQQVYRTIRQSEEIKAPSTIYLNVYSNGKIFAHTTKDNALGHIDDDCDYTCITKKYVMVSDDF